MSRRMARAWLATLAILIVLAGFGLVRNGVIFGGSGPTFVAENAPVYIQQELSRLGAPGEVIDFYRERGFEPLWVQIGGADRLRPEASQLAAGSAALTALLDAAKNGDEAALYRAEAGLSMALVDLAARRRQQTLGLEFIDPDLEVPAEPRVILTNAVNAPSFAAAIAAYKDENPVVVGLRQGLALYQKEWAGLPQVQVPAGPALSLGAAGARVEALRRRLGLSGGQAFDPELDIAVKRFQSAHSLAVTGVVDPQTLKALNAGAAHFETLIALNIQRAAALPPSASRRFVLVNVPSARLWLYEDGRPRKTMRVIVGERRHATPMMAGLIRYAVFNPYWNIPPDIVQTSYAPRVLENGPGYLRAASLEALSDWTDEAVPLEPGQIDWQAVASGQTELRLRQLPGPTNAMGRVKFMLPNELGIYLHDTPERALFERDSRLFSAGCVRVEDASALAVWLLGAEAASATHGRDEHVDATEPTPVYITYLTAAPDMSRGGLITFLPDVYGRDSGEPNPSPLVKQPLAIGS